MGSDGVKGRNARSSHGAHGAHHSQHDRHSHHEQNVRRPKWMIGAVFVAIVILLAAAYKGGRWLETRNANPETRGDHQLRQVYQNTIDVDGVTYRLRDNVTTILLMGIDQSSGVEISGYRNGGQADFIELIAIDDDAKKISRLQIDRDTMTPITVLGVLGDVAGERVAQISLSHGFGDGAKQSCELTADAVSNLLMDVPIEEYISMSLDGISVLNDAVGGVTVTLADDFSALDPAMTQGTTLTLQGEQAEIYVRSRMNIGVGTNEARMARQQEYISRLSDQLSTKLQQDQEFIGELYDQLEQYLVTSISRGRLINVVWNSRDYERAQVEIAGSHRIGSDGFMQFYVDETALQQTVLDMFYQKVG